MAAFLKQQDWFTLLQSLGIMVSLLIASFTLWRDVKSRKISNYIDLIQYHRDVWKMTMERPSLNRLFARQKELMKTALTEEEQQFLTFLFLHITCSFELQKSNHIINVEMLEYDVGELLKYPLIRKFWEENKRFYNSDFIDFVDRAK